MIVTTSKDRTLRGDNYRANRNFAGGQRWNWRGGPPRDEYDPHDEADSMPSHSPLDLEPVGTIP